MKRIIPTNVRKRAQVSTITVKERHIYLSVKNNAKKQLVFHTYAQPEVPKEALLQKNIVSNCVTGCE